METDQKMIKKKNKKKTIATTKLWKYKSEIGL